MLHEVVLLSHGDACVLEVLKLVQADSWATQCQLSTSNPVVDTTDSVVVKAYCRRDPLDEEI